MDEVDETVGEENKEWELQVVVEVEWCFGGCVIKLCVTSDLSCESNCSQDAHAGH